MIELMQSISLVVALSIVCIDIRNRRDRYRTYRRDYRDRRKQFKALMKKYGKKSIMECMIERMITMGRNKMMEINRELYSEKQLKVIDQCIRKGIDISQYLDPKFDDDQLFQIMMGISYVYVDVSKYADPRFSDRQMNAIREGLEEKLDVSIYADPKFDAHQMEAILDGLILGMDVSVYADPKIPAEDMWKLVNKFADEKEIRELNEWHMRI